MGSSFRFFFFSAAGAQAHIDFIDIEAQRRGVRIACIIRSFLAYIYRGGARSARAWTIDCLAAGLIF